MKRTIVTLTIVLGLAAGTIASAGEKQTDITKQDKRALKIELTKQLDPKDLADDICWVAPEWRDN